MTVPAFRPAGAGALLADFGDAIDEALFAASSHSTGRSPPIRPPG